jgi:ADP-heptose:LPS heptosyltransferase
MSEVLLIRPGALGDTLMVLPALSGLDHEILVTFAGRKPGIEFIKSHVSRSFDMDRSGWHKLFAPEYGGGKLPVPETELVVAFFSDGDGLILQNLKNFYPGSQVRVFPSFPPQGTGLHAAQYVAICLRDAGLDLDPEQTFENAEAEAILSHRKSRGERDSIVVHPGSGSSRKNYPNEFWRDMLESLSCEAGSKGLKLNVLIGPAEQEIYRYLIKVLKSISCDFITCPDCETLMKILGGAAVYVGHDSGITHLSAMLGSPTIALFKSTDVMQWRPLGPLVKVLSRKATYRESARAVIFWARHFLGEEIQTNLQHDENENLGGICSP